MKLGLLQNKDAFAFVVFCCCCFRFLYLISLQLSSPFSFLAEQSIMFHHRIMLRACHAKNEFGMQPFEFLYEFTNSSVSSSLSVFFVCDFSVSIFYSSQLPDNAKNVQDHFDSCPFHQGPACKLRIWRYMLMRCGSIVVRNSLTQH